MNAQNKRYVKGEKGKGSRKNLRSGERRQNLQLTCLSPLPIISQLQIGD